MSDLKICNRCQKELPIAEFSVNRKRPDQLQLWCKACKSTHRKKFPVSICRKCKKQRIISKFPAALVVPEGRFRISRICVYCIEAGNKICSRCGEEKSLDSFFSARGIEFPDGRFDMCIECCKTHPETKPGRQHYQDYYSAAQER